MCMRISMAHAVQHTCRKFSRHYQFHVDRKAVHQAAEGGAFLVKISLSVPSRISYDAQESNL